jgi:hypothetical protein
MEDRLDKLNKDIHSIFHHLDLFKKLSKIISSNQSLDKMDATLLVWMKRAFTADLIISVGRICDKDPRTESLVRFLEDLQHNKDYLSRERYIKLYRSSDKLMLELGNRDFDKLAGLGQQTFPVTIIQADIVKITEDNLFKKILTYRHQYVAHSDENRSEIVPTYDELFRVFEIIEGIVKKYNLLLRAASLSAATPVMQGNWAEVLTIPWIDGEVAEID